MNNGAIGFIGAGAVGTGLALALHNAGYGVVCIASRTHESARNLARLIPGCEAASVADLAAGCETVFITAPDDSIEEIASKAPWRKGQLAVHCSGALSLEPLEPVKLAEGLRGAFHPFQTFAGIRSADEAAERVRGATFAVDGDDPALETLTQMAQSLGGKAISLEAHDRPMYHASAVMSCGYLGVLVQAAVDVWREMGFSNDQALSAILPIARTTLDNISRSGVAPSVTGPLMRGDKATVASHISSLGKRLPHLIPMYRDMARGTYKMALANGVDKESIDEIEELVESASGDCATRRSKF